MFTSDINSPVYQQRKNNRNDYKKPFLQRKYTIEGIIDTLTEIGQKTLLSGDPTRLVKELPHAALLPKSWGGGISRGISSGYRYGLEGAALFTIPIMAYSGAVATKGYKVGRAASAGAAGLASAVLGGFLGGPVGAITAGVLLSPIVERTMNAGVDKFLEIGKYQMSHHLGGGYIDTQRAYTLRQRAAQEIGNGLLNARMHLGKEGMLYHQ